MTCIEVDNFIEMHDKPHTFLTVVDKTSVHRQVLYGVAVCVHSFEFTTGDYILVRTEPIARQNSEIADYVRLKA